MHKITLVRSLLALLIASLSACGDGGGGDGTLLNNAPIITSDSFNTREDTLLNHAISASDTDGDNLTFAIQRAASHGNASISPQGLLTYTPANNYHGIDQLTISVSDGKLTSSAIISIRVLAVNDLPVLHENSASLTLNEDTPISTSLIASDVEGGSLSYSLITQASKGIFDLDNQGNVTYTPNENENGNDTVTLEISDGEGSAREEIRITINPVNDAPEFNQLVPVSVDLNTNISGSVSATDADQDDLTFNFTGSLPSQVSFNIQNNGQYNFKNESTIKSPIEIEKLTGETNRTNWTPTLTLSPDCSTNQQPITLD